MLMADQQTQLHKEFELERMILFSDAVFAIAITLLIIEIKFPEVPKDATRSQIEELFKPVIIRFLGFVLSFSFIGLMWARHLKIFKYLKLPILVYLINIACVSVSQFILCTYLFKKNSKLSVDGFEAEKNYILIQSKFSAFILSVGVIIVFSVSWIFPGNTMYVLYSFYVIPVLMLFMRKRLKKFKPVSIQS